MAKKSTGRVNSALERALADEIKEISKKDDEGKYLHSTLDRMRVYQAALKLESIKLKADDPEWGSEFEKDGK